MNTNIIKTVSLVLVGVLVLNLVLMITGEITPLTFWVILAAAAIAAYVIRRLPKG